MNFQTFMIQQFHEYINFSEIVLNLGKNAPKTIDSVDLTPQFTLLQPA